MDELFAGFIEASLEIGGEFLAEVLSGLGGKALGELIPHSRRLGPQGSILGLVPVSQPLTGPSHGGTKY